MVNLPMKRSREEEFDSLTSMANCLMLLSGRGDIVDQTSQNASSGRVFECKTCSRQFPSFQALGGHRASHKRPRTVAMGDLGLLLPSLPPKPKTHECSICGQEFGIGQALGGHMRRHRAAMNNELSSPPDRAQAVVKIPATGQRVLCLDLNLTPLENDLEFIKLGKMAIHG